MTFYRTCDKEFVLFFDDQLNSVFCKDILGLLMKLGVTEYSPADWRLFIDSSKRSLKCVLLHITNIYGSVPIGHSTTLKEKYDAIKSVLLRHQLVICVDLKMVNFMLGQESGYTEYPFSFASLSNETLKAGIFDGPHIGQLMRDQKFCDSMNEVESAAWLSFVEVD